MKRYSLSCWLYVYLVTQSSLRRGFWLSKHFDVDGGCWFACRWVRWGVLPNKPTTNQPTNQPTSTLKPANPTMFRSPLRRFLSPKILPAASISRLCAARIPAQPLRSFLPPNCILFPLVSTRSFSESHEALAKSKNHFTKDHYDNLAESTLDGILLSLEALAEQREDVDVEYSVLLPPPHPLLGQYNHELTFCVGRRIDNYHATGDVRDQQAAAKSAALAVVAGFGPVPV